MWTEIYQWLVSYKLPVIFVVLILVVIIDLSLRLVIHYKMIKEFKNLKPLDILLKRYALGEINSKTFKEMKNNIAEQEQLLLIHMLLEAGKIKPDEYKSLKTKLSTDNNEAGSDS